MEWSVLNPEIRLMFSSLGSFAGDSYMVSPNCNAILSDILRKLSQEDRALRTFRRAIGFAQAVKKDLMPLFLHVKDDQKITDTTIKILVSLSTPLECLLPLEVMSKTDAGRNTMNQLNWLLITTKEAFVDPKATKRIVDHMKTLLAHAQDEEMSEHTCECLNDCLLLLRNILHIPENRTIPSNSTPANQSSGSSTMPAQSSMSSGSQQNQILWNLFAQNLDKVLMELMTGKHRSEWGLAMVQLVALMYKDQHVTTLQKLLNLWCETSFSESSEDNESNTSPPEPGSGDSSSSMVTSDPTSDSSDNCGSNEATSGAHATTHGKKSHGSNSKKNNSQTTASKKQQNPSIDNVPENSTKFQQQSQGNADSSTSRGSANGDSETKSNDPLKMECGSPETSDCGYGTQVENTESVSSSSNDDDFPKRGVKPVHQKPSNLIQKVRQAVSKLSATSQTNYASHDRKKKFVKRSRLNTMNMKTLLHHTPTDEDISHLLKEFTVDFLVKGYGFLVNGLQYQLLHNTQVHNTMDTSHFFWLVTYFLKFASQLELELDHIRSVLSYEVISYLIYEAVNLCEQFELSKVQPGADLTPCLRRMHLAVTAIREVITAVETYKKVTHLGQIDREHLALLHKQMCETEELRLLFVLLLRQYTPSLQSKQYLQDVIVTNHIVLAFIENNPQPNFSTILQDHMKQFVSVEIMNQYGLLLERFQDNGQFVNDCVFTMMHHVAGDLDNVSALFQPPILKTFTMIWESEFQLCDDWSDLIEFVIHKFINMPRSVPISEKNVAGHVISPNSFQTVAHNKHGWSQEECDNLYWYYVQTAGSQDPVGAIIELYEANNIRNKSRISVIEQLLEQDVISRIQYTQLLEKESISSAQATQEQKAAREHQPADEIEMLKDHLIKENKTVFVIWVQKVLLEACHAKLNINGKSNRLVEPVSHYCSMLAEPIPFVAWNCKQCSVIQYQPFALLLHKLGLHLPADAGKIYPRIPEFWGPDLLYKTAKKLGPVQPGWLKFDPLLIPRLMDPKEDKVGPDCFETKPVIEEDGMGLKRDAQHSPAFLTKTPE